MPLPINPGPLEYKGHLTQRNPRIKQESITPFFPSPWATHWLDNIRQMRKRTTKAWGNLSTCERWHQLHAKHWRGQKDDLDLDLNPILKGGCRPDKDVGRRVPNSDPRNKVTRALTSETWMGQPEFRVGRSLPAWSRQMASRRHWATLWVYSIRGQVLACRGTGSLRRVWTTYSSDCPSRSWARLPAVIMSGHLYIHRPVCWLFSFFPGHIPQLQACSQPKLVYFHKMFLKFTSLFTTGN